MLNELQWQTKKQIEGKIAEGIYSLEEVPCCICSGSNFNTLSEKDRYGLCLPVVICRDCGLVQTNPRMTQESYNQFYQIEYRKLYVGKDVPTNEFFRKEYRRGGVIFDYLARNLRIEITKLFIVEVGCAAGGILQYFKEQGNEVYGIDLDSEYIEFGRANYGLNIEVGTVDNIVKLGRSPDIVILSHVLEHILNPVTELIKLRSSMTNDSFLYIEVPGIKNLNRSYQKNFLRYLQNAHVYYFTQASLRNLLDKAGCELICGDEVIHSIFRKSPLPKTIVVHHDSEYESAMRFLRRLEFTRLLPTPYKLRSPFMRIGVKMLKAAGLYDFARRVKG